MLILVNLLLCWIHSADLKSFKSVFLMPHLVCKLEIKKCHMKGKHLICLVCFSVSNHHTTEVSVLDALSELSIIVDYSRRQ